MAITFDQIAGWTGAGTTSPFTVTRPTLVAGDVGVVRMYCIAVFKDYTLTATCTSNAGADAWTQIVQFADGTVTSAGDVGSVKVAVWYRDFPGTGDSNPSVAPGGTVIRTGAVMTLRKGSGETWATPTFVTAAITNWTTTEQTATASSTITVPDGAAVIGVAGIRDDTATFTRPTDGIGDNGSPAVTWNGNYVESPAAHLTTTTGNDESADAGYRLVTTGAAGVTLIQKATLSAAETGAAVWVVQGLTAPVTVTPDVVALVTTTFAPTVTASDHKTATPTTLALTTATFAPVVSTPVLATPTTVALVLSTFAPTVTATANVAVVPTTLALVLTTLAPTVTLSDNAYVEPTTAALVLTTFAPDVEAIAPQTVTPTTAALVLTTYAPVVFEAGPVDRIDGELVVTARARGRLVVSTPYIKGEF